MTDSGSRSSSAECPSTPRSCCSRAAWDSARSIRGSRGSRIATPAPICLKGTTLEPTPGNAPHRVWETPAGMLNSIGLQNPGSRDRDRRDSAFARFRRDAVLRQSLRASPSRSTPSLHGGSTTPPSMRWRSTYPVRMYARVEFCSATTRKCRDRVVAACRTADRQAARHQALAEPDRYRGERTPLHRGLAPMRSRW